MHVESPGASWDLKWPVVQDVVETASLFLVKIGRPTALVLPKRFFANPEQVSEWRRTLRPEWGGEFAPVASSPVGADAGFRHRVFRRASPR